MKTVKVEPNWFNPIHLLALGFGSGAAPKAPGTCGTLVAVLIYWPLSQLSPEHYLLMLLVTSVMGIYICGQTAKDLGVHDHGSIVWDEFVGFWITMFAAPVGWVWVVVGFVLFRFFDIIKPWPISWIDKNITGGFGIMLDDVIAGVMAAGVLQGIAWWL
ncbi:MAG: phosphatidylglycerophosphatase A [Oceanospirillaceae bacterium]|jgi:phosphatidylglycerophosphatase A|nr:phosphatidylglycerophosphatase A [Oceanospirillaceae bacterium]MBT4998705.1 phosphatidylglycerophosphatase A [Oceanospirillaceae bacterium]MBT5630630.1 phosphatidylglycerophosphatase A [Oceanospirillaceae bacterium]MBT6099975.1 phosphatidylglycerophosphatase A [Oceanospirillaceae bacterium]MBT7673228.1 phosphatidylglycerophosphatase A [Oceanospirillaceae bacterium]